MRLAVFIGCFVFAGLCPGCSSDEDGGGSGGTGGTPAVDPNCQAIIDACMPKDDGENSTVHDCHMLGHDSTTTPAECSAQKQTCVDACNAAPTPDGGVGAMGGMGGMAGMAGMGAMGGTGGTAGTGGMAGMTATGGTGGMAAMGGMAGSGGK